ncbi:hypothetical protein RHMOL_Rhmol10G0306200 [Rhododendron molle]|uniref:Uncharacterized protein n=1 Tax=Rhododendron molle TaxID=49168 RepID=A0ACC0M7R2_RHOML|nr:hypothetical protein RHMOL_Rhmol10G0306200 [Rhododendron molle]
MQRFDSFTINHIFREANKCADALASDTSVSMGEFSTIFTFRIVLLISYMQTLSGWNTQEMRNKVLPSNFPSKLTGGVKHTPIMRLKMKKIIK